MDFSAYLQSLQGKTVSVIGVGVSNRPLIELLCQHHIAVTARDKRESLGEYGQHLLEMGARLCLGEHYLSDLHEDVIFRTPGMRPDLPELTAAVRQGSILTSEMEVFFEVCPCPVLAISGSDGKTTTTTIIAELLRRAGKTVWLGGNIGHPLLAETEQIAASDLAVLELSSFQLMTMRQSPHIAVLTNISPNHLDVHRDYEEYIHAKEQIFCHQNAKDIAVFNADNDVTRKLSEKASGEVRLFSRQHPVEHGAYIHYASSGNPAIWLANSQGHREVLPLSDIRLPGVHNIENYMAAACALDGLVPDEVLREFAREFAGVEHRIELVRTRNGVRWYNDSIASSPNRTIAGLRSFSQQVILIAGGKDKGIAYDALGPEINTHVKALILCGATAGVIRQSVEQAENYQGLFIQEVNEYTEAVALADSLAREGDVVILSPASTSFDRFANFMERGKVFKELVNALP